MKLCRRETYLKKIRAFYHADDIIKVITGVRRCGKSSLMETIADELRESGIQNENSYNEAESCWFCLFYNNLSPLISLSV